jgi:hypothetical protein
MFKLVELALLTHHYDNTVFSKGKHVSQVTIEITRNLRYFAYKEKWVALTQGFRGVSPRSGGPIALGLWWRWQSKLLPSSPETQKGRGRDQDHTASQGCAQA